MPKRTKKTLPTCDDHLFILKPKHNFCRFSQTVSVSFCDPGSEKGKNKNKKCRNCQALDCPIFNKDKNFATPTFILCSQKTHYDQRGIKMREQHEKKMVEYTDEKDSLNIPKPRTRNNFCSVCRQVYEDYLDHIESDKHKKKINSSMFNNYILDVADKFNPNPKNSYHLSYHTLSTGDQDDVEIIENGPSKKVKTDIQHHERQYYHQDFLKPQIVPPPHLNLSNSAYFPSLGQAMNYMPNSVHPFPIPQPNMQQMPYNYNINMFMNPFYPQGHYGMMNPWMDYFGMPHFGQMPYEKMDQNYMTGGNMQQKLHRFPFGTGGYPFQGDQKMEMRMRQQEVIVIDDDEEEKVEKPRVYA